MVEWKISEVVGVADEMMPEPACRDKAFDPHGTKSFQPSQPRSGTHQRDVCRHVRGIYIGAATHHLNAPANNVRS
jgi:hypothetical protein